MLVLKRSSEIKVLKDRIEGKVFLNSILELQIFNYFLVALEDEELKTGNW